MELRNALELRRIQNNQQTETHIKLKSEITKMINEAHENNKNSVYITSLMNNAGNSFWEGIVEWLENEDYVCIFSSSQRGGTYYMVQW